MPPPKPPMWRIYIFVLALIFDATTAVLLMMPVLPGIQTKEGATGKYSLYGSLWDLGSLALLRVIVATAGLVWSYAGGRHVFPNQFPFELYHPNGEKKTRDELEEEASQEGFGPWFVRYICRPSFLLEMLAFLSQVLAIFKCLARMAFEAGFKSDTEPFHPIFWISILLTAVLALVEAIMGEPVTKLVNDLATTTTSRGRAAEEGEPVFRSSLGSSSLVSPLLQDDEETCNTEAPSTDGDEETATFVTDDDKDDATRGVSDIGADTSYKATWSDIFSLLKRDVFFIFLAFFFLLLAAVAQVYIPRFTGNILDALANEFADDREDYNKHMRIVDVPGFVTNVRNLVVAAILG